VGGPRVLRCRREKLREQFAGAAGRIRSCRRCCRCRRTRRWVRRRSRRRCRLGRLVPLPLAAERHYAYQQQVTAAVVRAAQLAWARVTLADLDGSWAAVAGGLLTLVTAAQVAAARDADPYLAAVLAEMGHPDDPAGQVQPAAFAGVASDGRGPRVAARGTAHHRQGRPEGADGPRPGVGVGRVATGDARADHRAGHGPRRRLRRDGRPAAHRGLRPRLDARRPAPGARSSPAASTAGPRASNATRAATAGCFRRRWPHRRRPRTTWTR
jgi:hypothetical protein